METTTSHPINAALYWDKALSYHQYRELIDRLLLENKTTGPQQSPELTQYTRMNVQRMQRLDKQAALHEDLQQLLAQIQLPMRWLVISEGWCGDAAQILPWLHKIADYSPSIELRIVLRDEHPELIDAFLTNGGRSIPKLIVLSASTQKYLGQWGPKPAAAQTLYLGLKAKNLPFMEASTQLHKWYATNKGIDLQKEMQTLIPLWAADRA